MENVWALASLWVGLALVATLLAIWFKISTALTEIVVGTVAQLIIGAFVVQGGLGAKTDWITFLAGTGAIVLTFLAGAELDPAIFRTKWKEAMVVGLWASLGRSSAARLSRIISCTGSADRAGLPVWRCPRPPWRSFTPSCWNSASTRPISGRRFWRPASSMILGLSLRLGLIFSPFTFETLIFVVVSRRSYSSAAFPDALVLSALRRPSVRAGGQVSSVLSVRDGRPGCVGRQRSGSARIHDRHGAGGHGRQRPRSGSPPADSDFWTSHAVLLHPRGVVCFGSRA